MMKINFKTMNIYYKRVITWQKWPDNDLIDSDIVEYSLSRKKWIPFYRTPPLPNIQDRIKLVSEHLNVKPKNIKLLKP